MLVNLKAEMARFNVSYEDIAKTIGKTKRAAKNRIVGEIEISGEELRSIRDKHFPSFTLDYLLSEDPIVLDRPQDTSDASNTSLINSRPT